MRLNAFRARTFRARTFIPIWGAFADAADNIAGGNFSTSRYQAGKQRRKVRIGRVEIREEIVEKVIDSVFALQSVDSAEIAEAMVERVLREYLQSKEEIWIAEYAQLIALEYERQQQEMAAIAMLWFEM